MPGKRIAHASYRRTGQPTQNLLAGQSDCGSMSPTLLPHMSGRKARVIAIPSRSALQRVPSSDDR